MLIGFVTDLHIDEKRLDGPQGHVELLAETARQIRATGCGLVLVGGDLAGTVVPHRATPRERNALVTFLIDLAQTAPVVIVRGNHDAIGDYSFLSHLAGACPILYVEHGPEVIEAGGVLVMALPWLDRGRVAADGRDYGAAVRTVYGEALRAVEGDLQSARAEGLPVVLLAHAAIPDAVIRPGQPILPSADPIVGLRDLLADAPQIEAAFIGHYHLHQTVDAPCPAWYGGSLFVNDHGEDPQKGWLCYNTETKSAQLQLVQQAWRVTIRIADGIVQAVDPDGAIDEILGLTLAAAEQILRTLAVPAYVRIVAKVPEASLQTDSDAIGRLRAELAQSALGVRVDLDVERSSRIRQGAAEVAEATTIADKVDHFAGQTNPPPTATVLRRSLEILADLEAEG